MFGITSFLSARAPVASPYRAASYTTCLMPNSPETAQIVARRMIIRERLKKKAEKLFLEPRIADYTDSEKRLMTLIINRNLQKGIPTLPVITPTMQKIINLELFLLVYIEKGKKPGPFG